MPEPAAPQTSTTHARPGPSANGTAPPVPSGATKARTYMRRPAALDRLRMAMTSLRRIVRRTARRA
jgi:hypothetical protein